MTRAMAILCQWDAAGRDIRPNGLAEGHNEILTSGNPYFQLCRPGLSSKLPLRGDNILILECGFIKMKKILEHCMEENHPSD